MTSKRHLPFITILLLGLSGCGSEQNLRPAAGEALPVKPATASKTPTAKELLDRPPIARPDRIGEIRTSNEREQDPFDLPPPG
jgi:hypothetical protein